MKTGRNSEKSGREINLRRQHYEHTHIGAKCSLCVLAWTQRVPTAWRSVTTQSAVLGKSNSVDPPPGAGLPHWLAAEVGLLRSLRCYLHFVCTCECTGDKGPNCCCRACYLVVNENWPLSALSGFIPIRYSAVACLNINWCLMQH